MNTGSAASQEFPEKFVGVPILDKGHREIIKRLNNLRSAIRKQVCRFTIDDAVAYLEEYAEVQFCEEELYMKHYGYPEYALHKDRHLRFVEEVRFLRAELTNMHSVGLKGSYELSVETVKVITDWIHDHIMTNDRNLREFLQGQGNLTYEGVTSVCVRREHLADGMVKICSICHKIRGKKGLWKDKEAYRGITKDTVYSHGLCPECLQTYYSDIFREEE